MHGSDRRSPIVIKQVTWMDVQGSCNPNEHADGRIAPSTFNAAYIGQIDFGIVGKLLLRQLPLDPQPPHIGTDDIVPVHRPD